MKLPQTMKCYRNLTTMPAQFACSPAGIIRSSLSRWLMATLAMMLTSVAASAQILSPYGVSVDATTKSTLSTWGPQMAAANIKSVRGFVLFNNIEPTQGTWTWTATDTLMNSASTNGLSEIGMLGLNASWINSNTQTFPTANYPAWSTYVSTTVTHCLSHVKYWEVWNEPPNFTSGTGLPSDYANVVINAYNAAKLSDPTCNVGIAGKSVDINWIDQTLVSGATDHFDFVTLHPYEVFANVDYGWEAQFMSIVPTVRKMLAARDPAKLNVPVIFTEVGEPVGAVNDGVTVTTTIQAQDIVKCYAMGLAQGVAQIDWFEGKDGDSGAYGLIDSTGTPRPAYTAISQFIQYMGSAPTYKGWVQLNTTASPNRDYGFVFQGASNTVMACWAPPGITDTITFASAVTVVNPVTGTSSSGVTSYALTNAPILVVGVPSALVTQATTNKTLPFPWGGDYTNATAVSIPVMAAPNTEQGLHQQKADVTSTAVTVYGGPARDWSTQTSQYFAVDPNFLSYTTTPIQITMVARCDAANDVAKMSTLTYESTTGYKNLAAAGWTIPGNDQWYTHTWTITDPQFVNMYGYNFGFYSPSNKYYVQSITVSKVTTLPAPWVSGDIGTVGAAGSGSYLSGTFTANGAGIGATGSADALQYVYQPVSGDCTITARVASSSNSNAAADAGVMIRETLDPGSTYAAAIVQPGGVSLYTRRATTGALATVKHGTGTVPLWVRAVRSGTSFSAYTSTDGTTWTQVGGAITISMASNIYVGLVQASGVSGTLATSTFDNVTVSP